MFALSFASSADFNARLHCNVTRLTLASLLHLVDAGLAPSGAMSAKTKFPTLGLQILSAIVQLLGVEVELSIVYDPKVADVGYFVGVSLLTHFVSRRVRFGDIKSFHGLKGISWTRLLILLAFIDSYVLLFTFSFIAHSDLFDRSTGGYSSLPVRELRHDS